MGSQGGGTARGGKRERLVKRNKMTKETKRKNEKNPFARRKADKRTVQNTNKHKPRLLVKKEAVKRKQKW